MVFRQGKIAEELGIKGHFYETDLQAMAAAVLIGRRSSCVRRKVGAVVLSEERKVIGAGWNTELGTLENRHPSCASDCPRAFSTVPTLSPYGAGPGRCIAQHAEVTAYRDACLREDGGYPIIRKALLAVSYTPCDDCSKFIERTGIGLIVAKSSLEEK